MPISPKKSPAFIVVRTRPVSDITSRIPSAMINISLATSPVKKKMFKNIGGKKTDGRYRAIYEKVF